MSVFSSLSTTDIPRQSPNAEFLRELDLVKVSNQEIERVVRQQLPESVRYSISCNNTTLSYSEPTFSQGTALTWKGKEIVLHWSRPKKFLYTLPRFFSGLCFPVDEEKFSPCDTHAIGAAFTSAVEIPREDARNAVAISHESAKKEVKKAYTQAVTIRLQISNSREFFDMKVDNTSILKRAYLASSSLRLKKSCSQTKGRYELLELLLTVTALAESALRLIPLQVPPTTELTIGENKMRQRQLTLYRAEFSGFVASSLFSLKKVEEFNNLRAVSGAFTWSQFTKKQLDLVRDSLTALLQQEEAEQGNTEEFRKLTTAREKIEEVFSLFS